MLRMRWFFAFFMVSGFCSLVYEIVWLRLAMAEFGVTTPLVSLVLAMFMAGLGLGCWGVGRLAHVFDTRSAAAPLRAYAVIELLIGCSAVAVPLQLAWGHRILIGIVGEESISAATHYGFSGAWIALTLLPWSACMGATVPLAMAAIEKGFGGSRRSFSYLYLANVLGAVLGTLVPAFVLIELLGFRGTLLLAATLNGLLALTALGLSASSGLVPSAPAPDAGSGPQPPRVAIQAPVSVLWLLFATGVISLAMEVVWIRQFTPYLGTVVYAFATILAAYLFATYVGSRAYRAWVAVHRPEASGLVWIGLAGLGLIPLLTADPRLPFPIGVHVWSFLRVVAGVGAFSAAVGFLTPMLVDRWSKGDARRAGDAYAINVLGSVVGPLLAGFVLLPWLSEQSALLVLTVPLVLIGALSVWRPASLGLIPLSAAQPAFVAVVVASIAIFASTEDFEGSFGRSEVRRDATAVVIATGEGMDKRLLINGSGMTVLTPATKMMAHLPLAFHTGPARGLVVAFGMGTSFRSLHSWGVHAKAVELVPSVVELFEFYHADAPELLASPKAEIVYDDGRRLLERSAEEYDVVIVDPPPPIGAAGSSLLYSTEFYDIVKRRLARGGILQQWLPDTDDVEVRASVAQALSASFPYVRAFGSFEDQGVHFLASMDSLGVTSPDTLAARVPGDAVQDLVEWGPHGTARAQFAATLDAEIPIHALLAAAPHMRVLEDNWAVNEYYWLRHRLDELGLR